MNSFLLDTHVWIWMLDDDRRLRGRAREIVEDPTSELSLSVASAWEISATVQSGRLRLPLATAADFRRQLELTRVVPVEITLEHAAAAGRLPREHGDPFDRVIVAQAQSLGIPLVTADPNLSAYDVEVVAA